VDLTLTRGRTGENSFEGFYSGEYPRLARALFLLCGDRAEAEDLAQEALARTYERWSRVREMDNPTGYVYRVALNLHRRRLRSAAMAVRRVAGIGRKADVVEEAETRTDVMRALAGPPPPLRAALILVDWMGLRSEEAAALLGMKSGSVRARVHRARKAFRTELGEGYDRHP
jgi:RNA polymerase sigma factor (sigma-70 family)